MVATTPGLAEMLQCGWQKAVRFYARFGITEAQFRNGVSESSLGDMRVNRTLECLRSDPEGEAEDSRSRE